MNFFYGGGDDNFIFLKLPHPLENPYLRPWDTMMSLKVAESIIKNNLFFKILFSAHNIQKNEMIYLMWKTTLFYLYPPPSGAAALEGVAVCWKMGEATVDERTGEQIQRVVNIFSLIIAALGIYSLVKLW